MEFAKKIIAYASDRLPISLIPTKHLLFSNKTFRRTYNFLLATESWTDDDVREWQFKKVHSIILEAYRSCPAYRDLYRLSRIDPRDITSPQDLSKIPTIDKLFVKSNYERLINPCVSTRSTVVRHTGGSTGTPMKFLLDREKIFAEKAFFYYSWEKHGYQIGEKCLFVKGDNVKARKGQFFAIDGVYNYLKIDSNYLNDQRNFVEYDRAIRRFSPRKAFGYPSAIYQLALMYSKAPAKPPTFDLIMLASENTYPDQIAFIKTIFSCPNVFFHYGHSEYASLAVRYHDNDKLGFVPTYGHTEIVDTAGKPVTQGNQGEIVATGYSRAMPLIRYRTNDFATLSGYRSSDYMKSYLAVDRIEGRLQEFIVTSDLRLVSICTMGAAHFAELGPVTDSQYAQEEPGKIVFRITCSVADYSEALRRQIRDAIEEKLEHKVTVHVERVSEIHRTPTGKKLMIEQKLDINRYI